MLSLSSVELCAAIYLCFAITILRDKRYFASFITKEANVGIIYGSTKLIEGSGKANVVLCGGAKFVIDNTLLSSKSQ